MERTFKLFTCNLETSVVYLIEQINMDFNQSN